MNYTAIFDFGDGFGSRGPYELRSAIPTERLCSDSFHRAACVWRIAMGPDSDWLAARVASNREANALIYEDGVLVFSGRIPPTDSWTDSGAALGAIPDLSDIDVEVMDRSDLLDRKIVASDAVAWLDAPVCDPSLPGSSIVHRLLDLTGLSLVATASETTVLHAYSVEEGTTVGDAVDSLLFQYGLVLRWVVDHFETFRWLLETPVADLALDETNVMTGLTTERVEREADQVEVVWHALKDKQNCLLYMADLPFGDDNLRSGYPIQPGLLWPEEANPPVGQTDPLEVWWQFDDRALSATLDATGTRIAKNQDFSQIVLTRNHRLDALVDSGVVPTFAPVYENRRARVAYRNPTAGPLSVWYCDIYGDVIYRGAENRVAKAVAEDPRKTLTLTAANIHDEAAAARLACALADLYGSSCYRHSIRSESRFELGSISILRSPYSGLEGLVIIVERSFDPDTSIYSYKAISIQPVSIAPTASYTSAVLESPRGATEDLQVQINARPTFSEASAIFNDGTPPSANAAALAISSTHNPNGMEDIVLQWSYTAGAVPADGFLVFAKRGATAPGDIDVNSDPAFFVPASGDGTYATTLTLPARQAGAGSIPIHYRFGVVSCGTRRVGTVVHLDGPVEAAGWTDKTFASVIQVDGYNYWNQDTGELRAGNATKYLKFDPAAGTLELTGKIAAAPDSTVNGVVASTLTANAANGATAYSGTLTFRDTTSVPNGVFSAGAGTVTGKSDGSMDLALTWAKTVGSVPCDFLVVLLIAGASAPTMATATQKVYVDKAALKHTFFGLPAGTYSAAVVEGRYTSAGDLLGTLYSTGLVNKTGTANVTATVNGVAASTLTTNAANGATAYSGTATFRDTTSVPNGVFSVVAGTGVAASQNADGSIDVAVAWTRTPGAVLADFLVLLLVSGSTAPTMTTATQKVYLDKAATSFRFYGLPAGTYSFGLVEGRYTANGDLLGAVYSSNMTGESATANVTAPINGVAASTVTTQAAAGNTAATGTVQYRTSGAPTNSPTAVAASDVQQNNGEVVVTVSYSYAQGAKIADFLLVFWREGGGACVASDPCIAVNPVTGTLKLLVKPGTLYRFGVSAVRRTELGMESTAIVSTAADMTTKTAKVTATDDAVNNYWDLKTGEMRVGNATNYLHVQPASGLLEVVGLDLELTESELITNDGTTELSHEGSAMVWRDKATAAELARMDGLVAEGIAEDSGDVLLSGMTSLPFYFQVEYNGKIFRFGSGSSTVSIYDTATGTTTLKTLPNADARYCAAVANGKVYLPGNGSTSLVIFDLVTETSTQNTNLSAATRYGAVELLGKVYMHRSGTATVDVFDIASSTWSTITLSQSFSGSHAFAHGSKLYFLTFGALATIFVYDVAASSAGEAPLVNANAHRRGAVYGDALYLPCDSLASIDVYNLITGVCTTIARASSNQPDAVLAYNGKLYVVELSTGYLEIVDVETLEARRILLKDTTYHRGISEVGGYIYIFGQSVATASKFAALSPGTPTRRDVGAGFRGKGADSIGPFYELFDGAKIRVSGASLTAYVGPKGEDGADGYQFSGQSVIVSTGSPTGGSDGDLWIKV